MSEANPAHTADAGLTARQVIIQHTDTVNVYTIGAGDDGASASARDGREVVGISSDDRRHARAPSVRFQLREGAIPWPPPAGHRHTLGTRHALKCIVAATDCHRISRASHPGTFNPKKLKNSLSVPPQLILKASFTSPRLNGSTRPSCTSSRICRMILPARASILSH